LTEKNINKDVKIQLRYTCAAYPPLGIDMSLLYSLGKDTDGFYYANLDNKYHAELWFIKMLFTPVDKTWEEVEKLY
jgi:hypothetical protein